MSWHQKLQDPIPEFALHAHVTPQTGRKERQRSRSLPPVTWGSLKNLTQQAEEIREQTKLPPTAENFVLSLITALNRNSTMLLAIILCYLCAPVTAISLQERLQHNVWVTLAASLNQSTFCMAASADAHTLLSTCLIPVCMPPDALSRDTGLNAFIHATAHYRNLHDWGPVSKHPPSPAVQLYSANTATPVNMSCVNIVGCARQQQRAKSHAPCLATGKRTWSCSNPVTASSMYAHILLPPGWFFTCNQRTFNYIPANLSDSICCLSRLTPVLPQVSDMQAAAAPPRAKRAAPALSPDCDADLNLLSDAEVAALAVSIVGVPGLAIRTNTDLTKLACAVAKGLNLTSTAIALLAQEQSELRGAVLDLQAATDYLLLLHHVGCNNFGKLCCFNLSDNSHLIEHKLQQLHNLVGQMKQNVGSQLWDWVWSWLPSNILGPLIKYAILILSVLVCTCCIIQCLPKLCALRAWRTSPASTAVRYHRLAIN